MLSELLDFMVAGVAEATDTTDTIVEQAVHAEGHVVGATAADNGAGEMKEANTDATVDRAVDECSATDLAGPCNHAEPEQVVDDACLESEIVSGQLPKLLDAEACAASDCVEEVADNAQERDQVCEESDVLHAMDEAAQPCGNEDLLEEDDPQPLELPEVLEEPVLAECEPTASPETCPEEHAAEEDEPVDAFVNGTCQTKISAME